MSVNEPQPARDRSGQTRPTRPSFVGVGVGPGDPELLTLKAARLIREADIVFSPTRWAGGRSMALEIVGDLVDPARQEVEIVPFPTDAEGGAWTGAAQLVIERLGADRRGVFLTEGDPLLFGSFGHLARAIRALRPDLEIETVPGVSSVTAAAAEAGIMLADYDERLAIVPATADPADLERTLLDFDCVVMLKIGSVLGERLTLLDRLGLLDRTVYVRRCGWPDREIVHNVRSLLPSPPRDYFALLIVRRRYPG